MTTQQAVFAVVIMAAVTAALRFLPFLVFNGRRKTPKLITYLGKVLPYAIMGMLVVYCMRDVSWTRADSAVPTLAASAVVVGLHRWKKNTLLSIIAGTAVYMILVQAVF